MLHVILLSAGSDIDFMIHGLLKYNFFGHEVWITTTHVCILLVMLILMGLCLVVNRSIKKASEVPGGVQNVAEMVVELLDGIVNSAMGKHAPRFYNYMGTVFVFILI